MQKNMDKIRFESRYEIDEVVEALETFTKEHPNARQKDTVKRLCDLLDVMYMEWQVEWWIQKFIHEHGRDNMMNILIPKITMEDLKQEFNRQVMELMKLEEIYE